MGVIVEKAWSVLRKRIAKERDISADDAEELMQEALYAIADYYDGKTSYQSVAQILDDWLGLPPYYEWVFRYSL